MSNNKPLDIPNKEPISDHTRAMLYVQGLLSNLKKLSSILSGAKSSKFPSDKDLVSNWSHVRNELTKRPLISTLLPYGAVREISNKPDELVVFCQKAGTECNFEAEHVQLLDHAEFNACFKFDIFRGSDNLDEATSQGIRNGHTFIFLSGSAMIRNHDASLSSLLTIPGRLDT